MDGSEKINKNNCGLFPSSAQGNYKFSLKGYHGERRGEREDMQDAHTMIDDFTPQFEALPNNM